MASNTRSKSPKLESVLVIGGCGFLGHHIVACLLKRKNIKISVFDVNVSRNTFPDVSYTAGDICSRQDVDDVLDKEKPQVVIHTASPTAQDQLGLEVYTRVNVYGTKTILEAATSHSSVIAFVYTSSAGVVFDSVSDLYDADETLPVLRLPEQRDAYSHTKGIADELVRAANQPGILRTCCLRVALMFGERDRGVTSVMIEMAKAGKQRFQIGDGSNLCDGTYIENAAEAHILAAEVLVREAATDEHVPGPGVSGEAFFITNGEPRSFWQFARDLGTASGYHTPIESVWVIPIGLGLFFGSLMDWIVWLGTFGQRQAEVGRFALNLSALGRTFRIDKARDVLGYQPKVSVDEGIRRSGAWWKNEVEAKKTV